MSPINMLNWWQWLVMASIPPLIVMLYFLKLRRIPVAVPSTYLWKKSIEDLHVNSIWQRLRKNLLLFLQLLIVLLLALACLRPGYRGEESVGDRAIFMIDNSSSMRSTDVSQSRLAAAKREALRMIDALGRGDAGMVIAFSDHADIKQGFTTDKSRLRSAVDAIAPTSRTTDMNEALRAAAGLANPGRTSQIEDTKDIQVAEAMPAMLYIFSDGGFGPPQIDLGNLSAEYIPIGTPAPNNVAILAFTAERNVEKNGQIEAFARLRNFSAQTASFTASLKLNDELVDATDVTIEGGQSSGVSFNIPEISAGRLTLELDVKDDFAPDNQAFAGLDPPRQLDVVLVTTGNKALEAALATSQAQSLASLRTVDPKSLDTPELQRLSQSGQVDLFIYDQCAPEKMPNANTMFFGALPPGSPVASQAAVASQAEPSDNKTVEDSGWQGSEPSGPLFIIDTNRSHPMLQYVDMGTVRIVQGQSLKMPPGGTELLRTDAGILAAVAPRGAYQDAVIGMPLVKQTADGAMANTDWPIKRSFPVFVFNSLSFLGGAVSTASAKTVRPGQPVALNVSSRFEKIRIRSPLGKSSTLERAGHPNVIYTQTDEAGFYEAKPIDADRVLQLFTVNLFSEQESDIATAAEVAIGASTVAANQAQKDVGRFELWRWLLALALIVLSVEWYLYNRRVAV